MIDKPKGKTSSQIVREYKKKLKVKTIGHAGTLDPFATGVLILLCGKATKRFEQFLGFDKEYQMTVELGWTTDTLDPDGKIIKKLSLNKVNEIKLRKKKILKILSGLQGQLWQEVPHFSALKIRGKPLYWYKRQNKLKSSLNIKKQVEIKSISLEKINQRENGYPQLIIKVVCSSGTYMRSLAKDIGEKLGVPALAVELRRLRVGNYKLKGK